MSHDGLEINVLKRKKKKLKQICSYVCIHAMPCIVYKIKREHVFCRSDCTFPFYAICFKGFIVLFWHSMGFNLVLFLDHCQTLTSESATNITKYDILVINLIGFRVNEWKKEERNDSIVSNNMQYNINFSWADKSHKLKYAMINGLKVNRLNDEKFIFSYPKIIIQMFCYTSRCAVFISRYFCRIIQLNLDTFI